MQCQRRGLVMQEVKEGLTSGSENTQILHTVGPMSSRTSGS